ncbi:hypothetical protein [Staphylococcus agnetis]|uniref:hypothetical protein n=1 Tax=Staphylococcus agnetis TaxID=985762 RepID=UPI00118B41A8|nr:hypothetical protein [Staphylococcus agnetis]QDW99633.1 hypothetical protein DWB91_11125 [Staphylococcus agnetis]
MIEYEYFHLDSENRKKGRFLEILHPDFEEVGQSGKRFKKEGFYSINLDSNIYEIMDFVVVDLSAETKLCKYILLDKTSNSKSVRSSIWVFYDKDWKLYFHQGTQAYCD